MKAQPISNPPNPWATAEVEYLEETPIARLEVYEDHTREIIAHNDSPEPGSVKAVFEERMRAAFPLRAERILHRIRETRGGELYQNQFGLRQRGDGVYADTLGALFEKTVARLGMNRREEQVEGNGTETTFRRPEKKTAQLALF